jgi:hypothetical protein
MDARGRTIGLALAALAAVMAGCGGGADSADASCSSGVQWRGTLYLGQIDKGFPRADGALAPPGVVPACNDQPDSHEPDRPATVQRVAGVPPALALRVEGDDRLIYLPLGYFTALPGHPLHDAVWKDGGHPYVAGGGRCHVTGRITDAFDRFITVHPATGRNVTVIVDVRTRVSGLRGAAGQPLFAKGLTIAVAGRRCHAGGAGRAITARTIRPA